MSATTCWDRWCSAGCWRCTSICSSMTTDRRSRFSARGRASGSRSSMTCSSRAVTAADRTGKCLWISRIAVAKGVFGTPGGHARSIALLTREYRHQPLRDLVRGVMRQCPELLADIDLQDRALDAHGHNFAGWLTVNGTVQRRVRDYLKASTAAFEAEIDATLGGRRRALLIDSGWQGTAQSLLAAAHPDIHWRGLYFGRILTQGHDPGIVPDCIGLMFEAERWDPQTPETAFVRHRHLIEALLEPRRPLDRGCPRRPRENRGRGADRRLPLGPARSGHRRALSRGAELCRRSCGRKPGAHPRRPFRRHAGTGAHDRATERGRSFPFLPPRGAPPISANRSFVPVISDPADGCVEDREGRIARALWTEGQIAAGISPRYRPRVAGPRERSACDLLSGRAPCWPATQGPAAPPRGALPAWPSSRRTKNAARAAAPRSAKRGVARASPISSGPSVNDGGRCRRGRRESCASAGPDPIPRGLRLVFRTMRAREMRRPPSNAEKGIGACDSDYVVIHR